MAQCPTRVRNAKQSGHRRERQQSSAKREAIARPAGDRLIGPPSTPDQSASQHRRCLARAWRHAGRPAVHTPRRPSSRVVTFSSIEVKPDRLWRPAAALGQPAEIRTRSGIVKARGGCHRPTSARRIRLGRGRSCKRRSRAEQQPRGPPRLRRLAAERHVRAFSPQP
jgi:hypothetical protein